MLTAKRFVKRSLPLEKVCTRAMESSLKRSTQSQLDALRCESKFQPHRT